MLPSSKFLHIATSIGDGAGIATRRIHDSLLASGARSRLLVRDHGNAAAEIQVMSVPPLTWTERLTLRLPFPASAELKQARRLCTLLEQPGPKPELFSLPYSRAHPEDHPWTREADIVHLHWVSGFVDYRRFFSRVRQPIVWTLHDQQSYLGGFHYDLDHSNYPPFHALDSECRTLKQSALTRLFRPLLVIGNSRWNTERACASGFFPQGTLFETVYYPLDLQAYGPRNKASAKIALGLDPRKIVVGFACTGLENPRKGLTDLLAALHLIENAPDNPPVTLLSFGRAPSANLRATLRSNWLHLGYLDADTIKCSAYAAMDIFVIPSRAEAFGQTAIEALASGTPVIGSDAGGIREALDDGRCGLLYTAGNVQALSEGLQALISDPSKRRALAEAGRFHVARQHDPSTVSQHYLALYNEALA